jgi:hypothetical protein
VVQVKIAGSDRFEEISLRLERHKLDSGQWGRWRAIKSEVEAVIGLWMLSFKTSTNLRQVHGRIQRNGYHWNE